MKSRLMLMVLFLAAIVFGQDHAGNFTIRFEPQTELATNVPIPFGIHVKDDLGKPVVNATVTLQIETPEHKNVRVFKAPMVDRQQGLYVAKPVFPSAGEWNVYVEVHQNGLLSARTIAFSVPTAP